MSTRGPVPRNGPAPTPQQVWDAWLAREGWGVPVRVHGRGSVEETCSGSGGRVRGDACENYVSAHRPNPLASVHRPRDNKRKLPEFAVV